MVGVVLFFQYQIYYIVVQYVEIYVQYLVYIIILCWNVGVVSGIEEELEILYQIVEGGEQKVVDDKWFGQ